MLLWSCSLLLHCAQRSRLTSAPKRVFYYAGVLETILVQLVPLPPFFFCGPCLRLSPPWASCPPSSWNAQCTPGSAQMASTSPSRTAFTSWSRNWRPKSQLDWRTARLSSTSWRCVDPSCCSGWCIWYQQQMQLVRPTIPAAVSIALMYREFAEM